MCGRSTITASEKVIEDWYDAPLPDEKPSDLVLPNYNVAPTHLHPALLNADQSTLALLRWGLVPFWANDSKIGYKMINARVETIAEKPAFKQALAKRRCIIPMDGYYEWKKTSDGKQPYRITCPDQVLFSVAGLWETWLDKSTGKELSTYTIITQPSNAKLSSIHDRMPAILEADQERLWLDDSLTTRDLLSLIRPYPDDLVDAYAVSNEVGNVRNNHEALIRPKRTAPSQGSLF